MDLPQKYRGGPNFSMLSLHYLFNGKWMKEGQHERRAIDKAGIILRAVK
jgi:hypothetical protein